MEGDQCLDTWSWLDLMWSQIFLIASERETSGAPTNFFSAGDTGRGFVIPVLAFSDVAAEVAADLAVPDLAAAIRALHPWKTLDMIGRQRKS